MTKPFFVSREKVEGKFIGETFVRSITGTKVDVTDYNECKFCGGFSKLSPLKKLSHWDTHCRDYCKAFN